MSLVDVGITIAAVLIGGGITLVVAHLYHKAATKSLKRQMRIVFKAIGEATGVQFTYRNDEVRGVKLEGEVK